MWEAIQYTAVALMINMTLAGLFTTFYWLGND